MPSNQTFNHFSRVFAHIYTHIHTHIRAHSYEHKPREPTGHITHTHTRTHAHTHKRTHTNRPHRPVAWLTRRYKVLQRFSVWNSNCLRVGAQLGVGGWVCVCAAVCAGRWGWGGGFDSQNGSKLSLRVCVYGFHRLNPQINKSTVGFFHLLTCLFRTSVQTMN